MLSTYVRVTNLLARLRSDERGVTAVEYGILAAAIAGAILTVVVTLGTDIQTIFNNISGGLPSVAAPAAG